MANLPPGLAQVPDPMLRSTLLRLWEQITVLETRLATTEADLATARTQTDRLPQLERDLRKVTAQIRRP